MKGVENPHDFGERMQGGAQVTAVYKLVVSCSPAHPFELSSVTATEIGKGDDTIIGIDGGGPSTCIDREFKTKGEECELGIFFHPNWDPGLYLVSLLFQYAGESETYRGFAEGTIAPGAFEAGTYPAKVSGSQSTQNVITIQGSKIECSSVTMSTELEKASDEVTLTPSYSTCTAFGFVGAEINANGCTFVMSTAGRKTAESKDEIKGGLSLACPTGKELTITAATCTVHVPAQTLTTNGLLMTNATGSPDTVSVSQNITEIHSKVTSGFLCPLTAKTTDTSGKLTGTLQFSASGGVGFSVS